MKTRWIYIGSCLVLALAFVMLLSACGGSPSTTPTTSTTPATSSAPATSTAPVASSSTSAPASTSTAATTQAPTAKKGGILKIGGVTASTLSVGYPPTMAGAIDGYMSEPAIDTLFTYDTNLKIVPRLALSYEVAGDSKSITLKLRKGVKFHDGSDFNATVVKWNMDAFRATKKLDLVDISSIDVVDDSTLKLNLSKFNATLISSFCGDAGRMISKQSFDANSKEWCEKHPIGTGPYKFVSWEKDVSFKYTRNDNWWGGQVNLDGYWRLLYADATSALMAFKNGDFDILVADSKTAKDLQATGKYNIVVAKYGRTPTLVGDSANPKAPFNDIRVRRAISHAIDVNKLGDSLSNGFAKITNQWSLPGTPTYNPDVVGYEYNPDKAKQLLADAGYASGFDTSIKYFVSDWSTNRCTAISDYLSKVGIRVTLVPQQLAQWDNTAFKGGWENGLVDLLTYTNPDIMTSMKDTMLNVRYISVARAPGVQDMFAQAMTTTDQQAKYDIIKKMQKIMVDDFCMATFLYVEGEISVKNKYVHDDMFSEAANGWVSGSAWLDK